MCIIVCSSAGIYTRYKKKIVMYNLRPDQIYVFIGFKKATVGVLFCGKSMLMLYAAFDASPMH